jgi:hypothetical protein
LNRTIIHTNCDYDKRQRIQGRNQQSIAYTQISNVLYLECNYNIFSTYSKSIGLQEISHDYEIYIYEISETVDITSYDIYKNGKHFDKTFGMESWDFSAFSEPENTEGISKEILPEIIEDPSLEADLNYFINEFSYDILYDAIFFVAEVEDS